MFLDVTQNKHKWIFLHISSLFAILFTLQGFTQVLGFSNFCVIHIFDLQLIKVSV